MAKEFTLMTAIGAVIIAGLYITIFSLVKEPNRQIINALIIAGAGATYWSGGLGYYEFPLGVIMIYLAFKGLKDYKFLALGWLVHTLYDVLHHLYGNPIVPMSPSSSAGCAICDPILALWLFMGAPSAFEWFRQKTML
ncbi:DUF6010 family protein [Emticicia sp. C21]|uniref:DUF6010 family protein n=1 Tax=Emticicia sp. C21 TaxID=2302915 RepID=UPI000E3467BD|nr:DUF6010 family protein [Emticicia sp. C21]RFS17682.1 hypothetical protein D0T08_00040 [Emticicia sp. C21]